MTARRLGAWLGPPGVILVAVAAALFDTSTPLFPLDLSTLGHAADTLLSADWSTTFRSPIVQVGPLHLLILGLLRGLARGLDLSYRTVFAVATQAGVAAAVMATVRAVRDQHSTLVMCGAGLATILGGMGWVAYISGHPEELVVGLMWVWAALAARRDRAVAAGLVLGLAAALKLTGALGIVLILLAGSRRERLLGLATFAGMCVLAYGPFLLFGDVRTFSYGWPIGSGLLAPLWGEGEAFTWWMRLVQGAVVATVGALAVFGLARKQAVVWAVPLALVVTRILLDPQPNHYFWLPFEAVSIVAAASMIGVAQLWRSALASASAYAAMTGRYLALGPGLMLRLGVGAVLVWLAVAETETLDPAPSGPLGPGGEEEVARPGGPV